MSELRFEGHPEIQPLALPGDATDVTVDYYPDGVDVHYVSATEGTAYLDFAFGGKAWDGVLGLADGSVEFASADGSFSSFRAIGPDDMPINPDDYAPTDTSGAPSTPIAPVDFAAFATGLMALNSVDHLVTA